MHAAFSLVPGENQIGGGEALLATGQVAPPKNFLNGP